MCRMPVHTCRNVDVVERRCGGRLASWQWPKVQTRRRSPTRIRRFINKPAGWSELTLRVRMVIYTVTQRRRTQTHSGSRFQPPWALDCRQNIPFSSIIRTFPGQRLRLRVCVCVCVRDLELGRRTIITPISGETLWKLRDFNIELIEFNERFVTSVTSFIK